MSKKLKVVFAHNLKTSEDESQAEYDLSSTVDYISGFLQELGYEVLPLNVSGDLGEVVDKLVSFSPDLIFNTAEGITKHGKLREAYFPLIFDYLGIPFTGSGAEICSLCLDKQAMKAFVSTYCDIPTPRWVFAKKGRACDIGGGAGGGAGGAGPLKFPLMIKPNSGGSSMGITQNSIVRSREDFDSRLKEAHDAYGDVLVEEFIEGIDVTSPFLQKAPVHLGVLPLAGYDFGGAAGDSDGGEAGAAVGGGEAGGGMASIYSYDLKHGGDDDVGVVIPPKVSSDAQSKILEATKKIVTSLGIRDLARLDYRVDKDGNIYFLEVNALPSLQDGAGLYASAAAIGLKPVDVIRLVVEGVVERGRA